MQQTCRIPCTPGTSRASSIIGPVLRNLEIHQFISIYHGELEWRSQVLQRWKNCSNPCWFLSQIILSPLYPTVLLFYLSIFWILSGDRRGGIILMGQARMSQLSMTCRCCGSAKARKGRNGLMLEPRTIWTLLVQSRRLLEDFRSLQPWWFVSAFPDLPPRIWGSKLGTANLDDIHLITIS